MILDCRSGVRGVLVNADTGERIPHARWANIPDDPTQVGEFVALVVGLTGQPLRPPRTYRGRCRLRFIPSLAPGLRSLPSVPSPVQASAAAPGPRVPRPRRVALTDPDRRCEHPACDRFAEWVVAEERELPAVLGPDGRLYEAAKILRSRWWCSWHYQRPLLLHLDGEIEPVEVTCGRPQ